MPVKAAKRLKPSLPQRKERGRLVLTPSSLTLTKRGSDIGAPFASSEAVAQLRFRRLIHLLFMQRRASGTTSTLRYGSFGSLIPKDHPLRKIRSTWAGAMKCQESMKSRHIATRPFEWIKPGSMRKSSLSRNREVDISSYLLHCPTTREGWPPHNPDPRKGLDIQI